jgi:thymidylate synthase (FAD)
VTPLLNHGYLAPIEHWGSDERVIEAARMSTAKGFQGWGPFPCTEPGCMPVEMPGDLNFCTKCKGTGEIPGDEKLLRYLYTHAHHTPFEMAGMVIEVQAPIFVFREWHRHRTQSYNELSARYTELPDMFYLPDESRIVGQSATNKQASGEELDEGLAEWARAEMALSQQRARIVYESLLKAGVAREVARIVIPVSQYSRMRASANLRNWLAFCTLRMDPKAQWEIRQYANAVGALLAERFPRTWALFMEGK